MKVRVTRLQKKYFNNLNLFAERNLLPPLQLLLPEYSTVGKAKRDSRRYTSISTGLSATFRPQAAARRVPSETCAKDH